MKVLIVYKNRNENPIAWNNKLIGSLVQRDNAIKHKS